MAALKTLLIIVLLSATTCYSARQHVISPINVGGLFNADTLQMSQTAFELVSQKIRPFNGQLIYTSVTDTYSTALEVCQNTTDLKGIVALLDGRPTQGSCDIVCLLCNKLNVAHLTIGWEPINTMSENVFTFSYYPPPNTVSDAFVALIKDLDWDRLSILYEDDSSFIRLQEVIGTWPHTKEPITFRKLDPESDNREVFKYIFKTAKLSHHIIDCADDNIVLYMKQILQVENSTEYQSFLLTNLDSHTQNLSELHNIMANVSTVYMASPNPARWDDYGMYSGAKLEAALAADALLHFDTALQYLQTNLETPLFQLISQEKMPEICMDAEPGDWSLGDQIRDALTRSVIQGFTGNVEFDDTGRRTNFQLHYSKLNADGQFVTYAHWNSSTKIIETDKLNDADRFVKLKENIRVVSQKAEPYLFIDLVNDTKIVRGYAVDLANEIFKIINSKPGNTYKLQFDEVEGYGTPMEGTKKWSGIIGELMEHKADLAIGDLSITTDRNSVVDFSTPFMSTGISMLFKERDPETPDMFSFINPFALDVWLFLMTTYIIVSFVLLICARMSQDDWVNPHPCNQNPENLQNIWSLYNCMWLTMGSIMTQGCDILPRGLGSRWTTGFWYFFAMIVTASYTANMSTFLSNSRRTNDIGSVRELSEQTKISYGAVTNASTYKFFKNSNDTVFSKIWQVMDSARPTVFTKNNKEGKDRVLNSKGNYAFFMEATAIKYYTERDCGLRMVGPTLTSNAYGIAMPKHFRLKGEIDQAILKLQESGKLIELEEKWWKTEDNPTPCQHIDEPDDGGSLQMKNTSGIFLVLGVGAILGLIVAVIEFILHARKIGLKEKVPFKEALKSEWEASLNPRALAKPADPLSSAPNTRSPSPLRERSTSRAVSVLRAATSFINFDEIY